jgi:hypothetical protein
MFKISTWISLHREINKQAFVIIHYCKFYTLHDMLTWCMCMIISPSLVPHPTFLWSSSIYDDVDKCHPGYIPVLYPCGGYDPRLLGLFVYGKHHCCGYISNMNLTHKNTWLHTFYSTRMDVNLLKSNTFWCVHQQYAVEHFQWSSVPEMYVWCKWTFRQSSQK